MENQLDKEGMPNVVEEGNQLSDGLPAVSKVEKQADSDMSNLC